ncbi:4a-hydroxytetrahydrobiopterin dehydratase [Meiothermus ruber]|jgi:4a-hydroxytetrahydrobiopterin dehydratase|uniref:Putative pterin-4-alpha-carbinolamine dehydratase n=1 Tax=Meiothermus ruber (strain ATCC 35948 / DSM 1279 / VKM B-1258 / 21) TaxID=504728 RepID=D3PS64_MEIRD|nr:4a-hydroxytetrahydrobiopterin dehydratase [Meiothermus ruber]GIW39035.1 MAG: putative pterin-4-alpha-carbinolamine dehydratase [Meiothermus sp.]ADD28297.1 transcriptional coactivator/pterin dehydratase [Meiothermus ruber DSM 1279]AGK06263.1 transcriptional coactivator/pterin dehydratase [Meiothermus ruber DSM 1279]MCL6529099.1 4a-hydroxytetrahydrobiopterin dehydratase [Meiothermus ruber]GAO75251.1 transcriptional coactivator/pterin dehydratase [Meiothermus ruber H328]
MATKLGEKEIENALKNLPGWQLTQGRIEKTYKFDSYAHGVSFAVRVALLAEKTNHHPDSLEIMWGRVKVAYVTHSAGGVTPLDLEAAAQVDALA